MKSGFGAPQSLESNVIGFSMWKRHPSGANFCTFFLELAGEKNATTYGPLTGIKLCSPVIPVQRSNQVTYRFQLVR